MSFLKYRSLLENHNHELRGFVREERGLTRERKLNLTHTLGHILYLSSQRNLNGYEITSQSYFSQFGQDDRAVRRSSFCEARQKVDWKAFQYLLRQLNQESHSSFSGLKWKGHSVKAIDGTFVTLPASPEVLKQFPRRPNPQSLAHYPYGLLVTAINVFTGQPVAAHLQDHSGSERAALLHLIETGDFKEGDLLLLDRGYEGLGCWQAMTQAGLLFVARVRSQGNLPAELVKFIRSGKRSKTCLMKRNAGYNGHPPRSCRIRFVRSPQIDRLGVPIILVTNLLDTGRYPSAEVHALYLRRWSVETMYYRTKELLKLESFHSRTLNGVLQEVWAHLVILSLTALLVRQATLQAHRPPARMGDCEPNFKAALEVLKRNFPIWVSLRELRGSLSLTHSRMELILHQIQRIYCRRQSGRKNPRISKQPSNGWQRGSKDRPKNKRDKKLLEKRVKEAA